jgi:hypothetical protein
MVNDAVAVPPVGTPLITPVLELSDNPAGRLPADTLHVSGAVQSTVANVVEYVERWLPLGTTTVVIAQAVGGVGIRSTVKAPICPQVMSQEDAKSIRSHPRLTVPCGSCQ